VTGAAADTLAIAVQARVKPFAGPSTAAAAKGLNAVCGQVGASMW
jgi:hypothetical protein